jgi:hypothetical protein
MQMQPQPCADTAMSQSHIGSHACGLQQLAAVMLCEPKGTQAYGFVRPGCAVPIVNQLTLR